MPNRVDYYIYALIDPRYGRVRYVGLGRGRRWKWCLRKKCLNQYGVEPWILQLRKLGLVPEITKVIEGLTSKQAERWERDLIDFIGRQPAGPLLNMTPGGGGRGSGWKHSEATLRKMSESKLGIAFSKTHKRNLSKAHKIKRKPLSETTKQKIAAKQKDKPRTGSGFKGRKHTKASKRKMSKAAKARGISRATQERAWAANTGLKRSTEARKKMSKARKGKPFTKKHCRNISKAKKRK